jgi:FG-GAP-like repeat
MTERRLQRPSSSAGQSVFAGDLLRGVGSPPKGWFSLACRDLIPHGMLRPAVALVTIAGLVGCGSNRTTSVATSPRTSGHPAVTAQADVSASPPPRFMVPTNLRVRSAPWALAVADFDGDGLRDFATMNQQSRSVSVILAAGEGRFHEAQKYPAYGISTEGSAIQPQSIAAGDLSGDGRADLAIANYSRDVVSVFITNGDGTLRPAVEYGPAVASSAQARRRSRSPT